MLNRVSLVHSESVVTIVAQLEAGRIHNALKDKIESGFAYVWRYRYLFGVTYAMKMAIVETMPTNRAISDMSGRESVHR